MGFLGETITKPPFFIGFFHPSTKPCRAPECPCQCQVDVLGRPHEATSHQAKPVLQAPRLSRDTSKAVMEIAMAPWNSLVQWLMIIVIMDDILMMYYRISNQ